MSGRRRPPGGPPPFLTRRSLLGLAAGGAVLAAGGCGGEEEPNPVVPSAEPAGEDAEPTATQGPIASPISGYLNPDRYAGRTLTVASIGGDVQDAQEEAYFVPFAEATGADVQAKAAGSTLVDDLKGQVEDGAVTWDVAYQPTSAVLSLARGGYLAPIDEQVVDRTAFIEQAPKMQYGVVADFFSTAIAYPAAAPPGAVPAGWADFWDLTRFGEGRALRRSPVGTLEFALIADGVAPDDLYPLDVERAFASLERIRPGVTQWWEDGKQPVALVASAQVGLASSWNVRADLPDVRGEVRITWRGGMLSADSWMVPAGAPNLDIAMDFIHFATRAVPNANFCRLQPFGPVNREALRLLRRDRLALLPTADPQRGQQFVENWSYWADNLADLTERFEAWLLSEPEPATP